VATLPLTFLATATVAFVAAALAAPWAATALAGHYYQPTIFALAHTLTLGWITLSIVGASCQIVPAVLGRSLWSSRLQWVVYSALLIGVVGMIAHFALAEFVGLVYSAALVGIGALLHVINVAVALARLPRWTFTARCVALALAGLVATVVAGVALGVNHGWPFLPEVFPALHAHVHVALLAWVLPMVLGVAAHAYPTFLLAREPHGRLGDIQLGGLALGVPGLALGLLAWPALVAPAAVLVAASVAAHLAWVGRMLRDRRRHLDWPLRFVLTGTLALGLTTAFGLGLAFDVVAGPRAALAYGVLSLGGWATFTIAGMMLKIVPFLVWSAVYAPRVGLISVPSVAALSWPAAERLAWALLGVGVAGLILAVAAGDKMWIHRATLVTAAGALAFAAAIGHSLRPILVRPSPAPLPLAGSRR
jgi:hypothetical protein